MSLDPSTHLYVSRAELAARRERSARLRAVRQARREGATPGLVATLARRLAAAGARLRGAAPDPECATC